MTARTGAKIESVSCFVCQVNNGVQTWINEMMACRELQLRASVRRRLHIYIYIYIYIFGRSENAFRIRRFMSKFLGVSLLSSASNKGRIWEHGPGTPCKLLPSRSFSERLERSEKAFRKRRFISKFLGMFLFSFGGKKERTWEHKARTTLKLIFRTPDICCSVENLSKICRFLCRKSVQGCVENLSKMFLLAFPKFYSVFWWSKKTQIVLRGAKIFFFGGRRGVKKGVSQKKGHFWFWSFLCWNKKKRKDEKHGKGIFQKMPRKIVFLGRLWRTKVFFLKMAFF